MFRIDDATAATSLPTPEAAGAEGYYTEGNPVAGTPATNVRASWLNMLQEELRAVVVAAGLTPSKTTYTQVRDAIKAMYGPGRLLRTSVYAIVSGQQQVSVNGGAFTTAGATTFVPLATTSTVIGEAQGGGAAGAEHRARVPEMFRWALLVPRVLMVSRSGPWRRSAHRRSLRLEPKVLAPRALRVEMAARRQSGRC